MLDSIHRENVCIAVRKAILASPPKPILPALLKSVFVNSRILATYIEEADGTTSRRIIIYHVRNRARSNIFVLTIIRWNSPLLEQDLQHSYTGDYYMGRWTDSIFTGSKAFMSLNSLINYLPLTRLGSETISQLTSTLKSSKVQTLITNNAGKAKVTEE
jgi:hypothetical protein